MTIFQAAFIHPVCDGDFIVASHAGFKFKATIIKDDDMGPPWKEHDGHGKVIETTDFDYEGEHEGMLVLYRDRSEYTLYDYLGAINTAIEDGWGTSDGRREGESDADYARRAVDEDYNSLKAWCHDEWCWVGVDVTVSKDGIELTPSFAFATWGIDSTSPEYITEVASTLAEEALKAAQRRLIDICTACLPDQTDGNVEADIVRLEEKRKQEL